MIDICGGCGLANPADDPAGNELGRCRECGYPPDYWITGPELPVVYVTDREIVMVLRKQLKDVCYVEYRLPQSADAPIHLDLTEVPSGTILPGMTDLVDRLRRRLDGVSVTTFHNPIDEERRPAWKSPYDRRHGK